MDTSETYIKMCEKAVEIQPKSLQQGDNYVWGNSCIKDIVLLFSIDKALKTKDRIFLPRQDQLQEMVGNFADCMDLLERECNPERSDFAEMIFDYDKLTCRIGSELTYFSSMEQLWLAFVMKEKYNKVWNGTDWELDEQEIINMELPKVKNGS